MVREEGKGRERERERKKNRTLRRTQGRRREREGEGENDGSVGVLRERMEKKKIEKEREGEAMSGELLIEGDKKKEYVNKVGGRKEGKKEWRVAREGRWRREIKETNRSKWIKWKTSREKEREVAEREKEAKKYKK